MVGDRGDSQGPGGVPPLGGPMDHGDDGKKRGRRRVGVPLVIVVNVNRRYPPYWGVHQETASNHSGKGGLLSHI